jgi:hypothetical protein
MARPGDYIVGMGQIIVPNVTEISIMKNLINMNPRGAIDTELWAENLIPGVCFVRTSSNVEDWYRYNAPFFVLKKISGGTEAIGFLSEAFTHLRNTKYYENFSAGLMSLISLGYMPVFIGATRAFQQQTSTGGTGFGYDCLISAHDLTTFLMMPFQDISSNYIIPFEHNATNNLQKTIMSNERMSEGVIKKSFIGNLYLNNAGNGPFKRVVGRGPFVTSLCQFAMDNNAAYKSYLKQLNTSFSTLIGALTKPDVDEVAALIAMKSLGRLKVAISGEHQTSARGAMDSENAEAILVDDVKHVYVSSGGQGRYNKGFNELLANLTPKYFYETFVREDIGEFVFRRASWIPAQNFSILGRQRQPFQNPSPIVIPWGSLIAFQKLYGGKINEVLGDRIAGNMIIDAGADTLASRVGDKNIEKFGGKLIKGEDIFHEISTINYDPKSTINIGGGNTSKAMLNVTLDFCGKEYFNTGNVLTDDLFANKNLISSEKFNSMSRMSSWITKFNHSYNYFTWLGFSTYFMAPIGASIIIPSIVPGQTVHPPSIASPIQPLLQPGFTSPEYRYQYRICGKGLKVSYRYDGAYTEEYYLLCSNSGLGFDISK